MRALSPWPQRTTNTVGVLFLVSGALLLIEVTRPTLAITDSIPIPFSGLPVALLAATTRAAAFLIAATGLHQELGFAARFTTGKTALVIWGLRDLLFLLLGAFAGSSSPTAGLLLPDVALQALFPIAALLAAVTIARARVLVGYVRWVLLPLAVVEVFFSALFNLPATALTKSLAVTLASLPIEFIEPILMLLIAIALLTWGRTEALKHRARTIHDAW